MAIRSTLKVAASVIFPRAWLHRYPNNVAQPHSFANAFADVDSNRGKVAVATAGEGHRA